MNEANRANETNEVNGADKANDANAYRDRLQPMIVRASAGTGKTYRLTGRLLKILLQGCSPETILATTFTRKAAGEITSRLLGDLAAAAIDDAAGRVALEKLRGQVEAETLSREHVAGLLKKVLANIHRLRIGTLDSVFSQLARGFSAELDLPVGWRLTDAFEEEQFRVTAIDRVIDSLDASATGTLLAMLSGGEVRRSIARELTGVVASTHDATRGGDDRLWDHLPAPESIDRSELEIAASEFGESIDQIKHQTVVKKVNGLIELLRRGDREGITDDSIIVKIAQSRAAGEPLVYYRRPIGEWCSGAIATLYRVARSHRMALLRAQNEATRDVLVRYVAEIDAVKRGARALGFDDVVARLSEGIERVDADSLRRRLDASIDHVLLDEFQDTSPIQWRVLHRLSLPSTRPNDDDRGDGIVRRSFFCVGDTKQAIYGWRGGVSEVFDAVSEQIAGLDQKPLNESFRSSPAITQFVNRVFANLTRHPIADAAGGQPFERDTHEARALRGFVDRFPEHRTARTFRGRVEFATSAIPEDTTAEGRRAAVRAAAADRIEHQFNQSHRSDASHRSNASHRGDIEIGVLVRTNDSVAEMIAELSRRGLDVSQEGGNPLTDSAAVELVLSALMAAEHPGDRRWAFHVSQTELCTGEFGGDRDATWTPARVRRMIADDGLAAAVRTLADAIADGLGENDLLRLKQLVALALNFERRGAPRIGHFVDYVRTERVSRSRPAPIRVMTIHQSKGLEFDVVVMPEIDKELVQSSTSPVARSKSAIDPPTAMCRSLKKDHWHFLPPAWQQTFGDDAAGRMTEALCLLYVAITRAKRELWMIATPDAKMKSRKTMAGLIAASLDVDSTGDGDRVLFESVAGQS